MLERKKPEKEKMTRKTQWEQSKEGEAMNEK